MNSFLKKEMTDATDLLDITTVTDDMIEDEVKKTARLNDERIEMGEEVKVTLDRKITNGDVD